MRVSAAVLGITAGLVLLTAAAALGALAWRDWWRAETGRDRAAIMAAAVTVLALVLTAAWIAVVVS